MTIHSGPPISMLGFDAGFISPFVFDPGLVNLQSLAHKHFTDSNIFLKRLQNRPFVAQKKPI